MASRDYRLLIDANVIDFLRRRLRGTQETMLARLRQIAAFPANFYDFTERDRVGRDLGVHMFGNYAIRFWEDPADEHLKVLDVSSVIPPENWRTLGAANQPAHSNNGSVCIPVDVRPRSSVHRPLMKMRERVYVDPSLKIPFTHPWLFSAFYLPAVGSTIAGSMIYKFSWFNLLLPVLWCFPVSCFILEGLTTGVMTDNHGTASRRQTPVRYWLKVGIWSVAYLFALVFPVAYALQEKGR